jgi:Phage tail lysozyme
MVGRADIVNDATSTAKRGNVPIAKTNKEIVLRHLQQKYSFNKHQVAAVMASVQHESNFQLDARGDAGTAFGLFQWRFDRDAGRKQFIAARSGQDRVTAEVDYAMHEMGILRDDGSNRTGPKFGSEKKAGNSLKSAQSVSDAINAMKQFERYNDSRGETGRRLQTAQKFFGSIGDFAKGNAVAAAAPAPVPRGASNNISSDAAIFRGPPTENTDWRINSARVNDAPNFPETAPSIERTPPPRRQPQATASG